MKKWWDSQWESKAKTAKEKSEAERLLKSERKLVAELRVKNRCIVEENKRIMEENEHIGRGISICQSECEKLQAQKATLV
jgi:hypothetical protein